MTSQTELAHLSRVLTMGELTASIAHEVNQPIAAVVNYGHACLEWLSAEPPDIEEARQAAENIIRDGTRAGSVIGQIRALFKKELPAKGWFDINDAIQELAVFVRGEILSHRVSIRTELAAGLPKVKADRVQLQQVVLNLVVNGMDAMRNTDVRSRELLIRSQMDGSSQILIQVEDSGEGLPADFETKIFNPFFTTKTQGIGMGLSISRSIIESHGGRLSAKPRPTGGAIFQFTFQSGHRMSMTDSNSIIYVVDDDPSIRDSVRSLLKSVGLHAVTFESPDEFMSAVRPEIPSCLLLDVALPAANGLEFQAELAKIGIHIPIVFITAHGDIPMTSRAIKAGAVEFLTKPFQKNDLLTAIHQALDRDRSQRKEQSDSASLRERHQTLTSREREVMALVVTGLMNKEVAAKLGLSEVTIKIHRGHVMQKMKAKSLAEFVRMADRLKPRSAR